MFLCDFNYQKLLKFTHFLLSYLKIQGVIIAFLKHSVYIKITIRFCIQVAKTH